MNRMNERAARRRWGAGDAKHKAARRSGSSADRGAAVPSPSAPARLALLDFPRSREQSRARVHPHTYSYRRGSERETPESRCFFISGGARRGRGGTSGSPGGGRHLRAFDRPLAAICFAEWSGLKLQVESVLIFRRYCGQSADCLVFGLFLIARFGRFTLYLQQLIVFAI